MNIMASVTLTSSKLKIVDHVAMHMYLAAVSGNVGLKGSVAIPEAFVYGNVAIGLKLLPPPKMES